MGFGCIDDQFGPEISSMISACDLYIFWQYFYFLNGSRWLIADFWIIKIRITG
jgi:hypothetical protein